jgi:hypothetical protein
MSIRLSSAQVTRLEEAVQRYQSVNLDKNGYYRDNIPARMAMEDLVEDILKEVLPCPQAENKNEQRNANV